MANADDDQAPLISHGEHDDDDDDGIENELRRDVLDAEETETRRREGHIGSFVWLLTFSACISGLLFGCK